MKRQYFGLTPLASLVLIALTAKAAWQANSTIMQKWRMIR
ncbi:Uncharacterised protein [Citrobacter koseri]|nr:Uncharacterised protein [Citrobacter koseri]